MELHEYCQPKQMFSEMVPVHVPANEPENRSMGIVPEWGEMLSAISADGKYMEDLTVPGFVANPLLGDQSLIINRVFAPFGEPRMVNVVRGDLVDGQLTLSSFLFGPATGATPIHPTNAP